MANPIKSSDLYLDDGAIKKAIAEWKAFRETYLSAIRDMRTEAEALKNSQKLLNGALKEHRDKILQTAQAASNLKSSYGAYQSALSKTEAQLKKLQAQQDKMTAASKKAKGAQDDQAKSAGKLGTSFKNLTSSVKGFLSTYLGLSSAFEVAKNIFRVTKELDSLEKAYRKVTRTGDQFARSQEFVKSISEDFGQEILTTSRSYMKFFAAIQTTNLGVTQAESIFRSFAKVNAQLGLSADDAKGVFLALEQMISKGKISTEELRLQMGERIPGAFQIMAKAVGVSSGELSNLLKQGKVMSADVLPKFAQELEKAFGVQNVDRIDMLASAQNRLSNAWAEFVQELDSAELFTKALTFLTNLLKSVTENIDALRLLAKGVGAAGAAWVAYRSTVLLAVAAQKLGIGSAIAAAASQGGLTVATRLATSAVAAFNTALRLNPLGIVISALTAMGFLMKNMQKEFESGKDMISRTYKAAEEGASAVSREMAELIDVTKDETKSIEERQKALEDLQRIAPDQFRNMDIEKSKLEELRAASDEYTSSISKQIAIKKLNAQVEEDLLRLEELKQEVQEAPNLTTLGGVAKAYLQGGGGMFGLTNSLSQFGDIKREREAINDRILAAQQEVNNILGGSLQPEGVGTGTESGSGTGSGKGKDLGAIGSLERLKAQLKKLEDELMKASPADVPGLIAKVLNAKQAVEDAEKWIASLKDASDDILTQPEGLSGPITPEDTNRRARERYAELEKELIQERIDAEMEQFEIRQDFQKSGFDLFKKTEVEKKEFAIRQEKEKLEKQLELNERFGGDLSEIQRKTIRNQIQGLEQELNELGDGSEKPKSLFDMLGISIDDPSKEALKAGFDFAKEQVMDFFKLQRQLAQQRVTDANRVVSAAQRELSAQIRLAELGYANKVDIAQKELALAKEQQKKALRERQKAVRAELAIQSIEQGVNLVTASTKILKTVPFPFNLAAIGIMFGAFAAAKIKAFQLTKEQFGGGGLEIIGGGTHASGNDTPLGFVTSKGNAAYGEKDEAHAIVNSSMSKKYMGNGLLPTIVDSLNKGTFEDMFAYQNNLTDSASPTGPSINNVNLDMRGTEKELKAIRKQGGVHYYEDRSGNTVEIRGNRKTKYL